MKQVVGLLVAMMFVVVEAFSAGGQYQWDQQRSRVTLSGDEEKLPELMIKNHVQYEYTFENDEFVMYSTHHKIIYVNSNEAIQKHNRIYIAMTNAVSLITLKARSINRAGKAVYFNESDLKEIKEEESGNAYRIFAMEGVEIGSEIEYFYTRKMVADVFNREFLQFDMPVKNSTFKLFSPKHLEFDFKSYNDLPLVIQLPDTSVNIYEMNATDIEPIKEEPYASTTANRKRVEYKLAYNKARSQKRLYTWEDAARRFYEILTTNTKGDLKAVEKFVSSSKIDKNLPVEQRIRKVEALFKRTININEERGDEASNSPESILKYKVASKEGIVKLYMAVFAEMNIKVCPVLTCSRDRFRFDEEFDSWSYLDDYLLYFPDTKGYLAPYFKTRYPLVPGGYTSQKALFVEPLQVGNVKSALAAIKEIPAADYLANQDNLDIDVKFDADLESNTIVQLRSFTGFTADDLNEFYEIVPADKRKQMVEELIKQTAADAQVGEWSANPAVKSGRDWFEMKAEFKTGDFIEKAGPRVLFKVGLLIGPQVEMYRDDQRTMVVENDNIRNYDRLVRIHIPAGYTVKNADQLKMNFTFGSDAETPFLFKSDYATKGDILEITISEFYKEIYVPLDRYEDFRKVVNAAADFNKVTLILEKSRP
jgi:hypothetical protein